MGNILLASVMEGDQLLRIDSEDPTAALRALFLRYTLIRYVHRYEMIVIKLYKT